MNRMTHHRAVDCGLNEMDAWNCSPRLTSAPCGAGSGPIMVTRHGPGSLLNVSAGCPSHEASLARSVHGATGPDATPWTGKTNTPFACLASYQACGVLVE